MISSADKNLTQDYTVIVLDLICSAEHRFDGWFASQEAFELQNRAHMVCCPNCGSVEIRRLPSAPHLARTTSSSTSTSAPKAPAEHLIAALQERAARAEDVGRNFPDEARRIHYGDAEERVIKGIATPSEARELLEEGVSVLPVPKVKTDLH